MENKKDCYLDGKTVPNDRQNYNDFFRAYFFLTQLNAFTAASETINLGQDTELNHVYFF